MDNFKKYFIRTIKMNYPSSFDTFISETDKHYKLISADTAFAKNSKNPIDKRLDFSSYFLAFIKTLDELGQPFEQIKRMCIEIATDYVKPKNKIQTFIK